VTHRPPAVDARDLTVSLGGRPTLRGISIQVAQGEVVALLGANGSGKSTLVRTLVGLVPSQAGRIELFGVPLERFKDWHRIGYVPQRVTAVSAVPATVREVVSSGRLARARIGRPLSRADHAAVGAALETVGLAARAGESVAELSGGQQQRVLIARALAGQPDLLVLDEPLAGVDLATQRLLADTLARLVAGGTTILLVAHELGPLDGLIGRAVVLRDGVVAHDGPPPVAAGHHGQPGHDHVHPHDPVASVQQEARWLR